jgi:hypothetical protein
MKIVELKREMDTQSREVIPPVDKVEARICIEHEKTRRHMKMLIGQLIAE